MELIGTHFLTIQKSTIQADGQNQSVGAGEHCLWDFISTEGLPVRLRGVSLRSGDLYELFSGSSLRFCCASLWRSESRVIIKLMGKVVHLNTEHRETTKMIRFGLTSLE